MKLLLTLLALLLVPISITAEDYDPEYWECDGDRTMSGPYGLERVYRRIPSRWTMTVRCDTVKVDCYRAWRGSQPIGVVIDTGGDYGQLGIAIDTGIICYDITTDTLWTKLLPVYVEPGLIPVALDSAQYKRLLESLMPPTSLDSVAKWIWGEWHGVEEILPYDSGADSLPAAKTHRDSTYDHKGMKTLYGRNWRVMNRNQ